MGMAKYDRLLYILNLLRSRRSLNARALAEECQVTERSIYRDILSLSEANVPIYYDRGYKLASENFLPALNFTLEEYTTLKLALESSPLGRSGRKAEVLKHIKAKIDSSLSTTIREQKKTAVDTTFIDIESTMSSASVTRFFSQIEHACSSQTRLNLKYETIEHGLTERVVDPYFIVFRGRAFYFVAYCHLRKDFRTFRLDRIRQVKNSGDAFTRKRGIDARDYFAESWLVFSGEPVEVEVRFIGTAAKIVASSRHHSSEKVDVSTNGSISYRVTVAGTHEIKRWILGFGEEAEVIRPKGLRDELARSVRKMVNAYEPSRSKNRRNRRT